MVQTASLSTSYTRPPNFASLCDLYIIISRSCTHKDLHVWAEDICNYYPNLVILPVDNNEHQRIDDVSTDRISYDIRSVETMGFAL